MAVELRFRKADATPWGFRLTGGADYETPLTVVKVTDNSLAEDAGMQVGDVIVRINDISTTKLTHAEAHDVILKAGNDFVLGVRRGGLPHLPRRVPSETSVENEEAVTTTKSERKTAEDPDLNITDEEIADIIGEPLQTTEEKTIKESEVLQAVTAADEENKSKERKWSTFLQKPKNPIPKPPKRIEEGPKGPPYRVVIKKQPKKNLETSEPIADKIQEDAEPKLEREGEEEEGQKEEDAEQNEEGTQQNDEDLEKDDESEGESPKQSPTQSEAEEDEEDLQSSPQFQEDEQDSSLKESDIRRMSASLEEQLAQVQKQLLALSKLPSAIQSTLNAVTQQLELIVNITRHEEEEVIQVVEEEGTEEVYEEKALSTLDEEEASELGESIVEEARREDEEIRSESTEDFVREEQSQIMTEEELEAQREEQERLEKREKVNHWNHIWPWSDVSKPVYRINFLKYQPPPKNLDHLQRSDVYRMIHDMEPPIRGIKARETKVLAEQDYYAKKEETVASLSPQMER